MASSFQRRLRVVGGSAPEEQLTQGSGKLPSWEKHSRNASEPGKRMAESALDRETSVWRKAKGKSAACKENCKYFLE